MDNLGQRLVVLRKLKGFNQGSFAEMLNVSKPTLVRYENNSRQPNSDMLSKLIILYSVNINWLLTGKGEMFIEDKDKPTPTPTTDQTKPIPPEYQEMIELMDRIPDLKKIIELEYKKAKIYLKPQINKPKPKEEL
jgi:transcriptional regulator with XRE-family HTH domain